MMRPPASRGGTSDGASLDDLRARLLPPVLLDAVARERHLLVAVPVGVGKSHAADRILCDPATYEHYDLVVYVAPLWSIIRERAIVKGVEPSHVPFQVLEARPRDRCGPLDPRWSRLEASGCAAHAKATLCSTCPSRDGCTWPDRLKKETLADTRLLFLTDANLNLNRQLIPFLAAQTEAERVLLILDEARLIDGAFELVIPRVLLPLFARAVTDAIEPAAAEPYVCALDNLAHASTDDLAVPGWVFPFTINLKAQAIQAAGISRFGSRFGYLGYLLSSFASSRLDERWRDEHGDIHFVVRPYLAADTLILSAHMRAGYVAHRLGVAQLASPFEGVRLLHSGTRIINLKSRLGAKRYFRKNAPQLLDFFAALIARNVAARRTTVLVSCKDFKALCAKELVARLAELGHAVRFVTGDYGELGPPDPLVVPIIHYGMAGVNDFIGYESCYCLNSFYVPIQTALDPMQEGEPEPFKLPLAVETTPHGYRRAVLASPTPRETDLAEVAELYRRKMEADTVLQAVGRVRYTTHPREVVLFQMDDFTDELGEVVELESLAAAYRAFGVPRLKALRNTKLRAQLLALVRAGLSRREAARRLGINREKARRLLAGSGDTQTLDK